MSAAVQLIAGISLPFLGWLLVRRIARWSWNNLPAVAFDLMPPLLGWSLLLIITARPISSGIAILALACGLALTDATKREVLREPVVFSDMSEFPQLFTHPELYFPFASRGLVFGGGAFLLIAFVLMLALEHPLWWHPILALSCIAAFIAAIILLAREPYLGRAADQLRRYSPSTDPEADASRLGVFSMLLIHGIIARAEREGRRSNAQPDFLSSVVSLHQTNTLPTIVLLQGESFFDVARLSSAISPRLLEGFDRCRKEASLYGRLRVPAWGANTMRAEFAAISGLSDEALGYDRFNPYHAFARKSLPSLAASLKAVGYRTICIHPFDRRFYRRDLILPLLGFDRFIGAEAFKNAEMLNGWISDRALGELTREIIAAEGPQIFVFAITMENHGPWMTPGVNQLGFDPAPTLPDKQHRSLRRYLAGIGSFDRLVSNLHGTLTAQDHPAVLAAYGDHLPSLPEFFNSAGHDEADTDYLIWHSEKRIGEHRNLAAYELPKALLDVAFGSLI